LISWSFPFYQEWKVINCPGRTVHLKAEMNQRKNPSGELAVSQYDEETANF
jgi:hypothetical protein